MSISVELHNINVTNTNTQSMSTPPSQGKLGGRKVVIEDPSYAKRNDLKAGVGPGMLSGLGRGLVTIALLFASFVATITAAITTAAWAPPLITLGCCLAATGLIHEVIRYHNPSF